VGPAIAGISSAPPPARAVRKGAEGWGERDALRGEEGRKEDAAARGRARARAGDRAGAHAVYRGRSDASPRVKWLVVGVCSALGRLDQRYKPLHFPNTHQRENEGDPRRTVRSALGLAGPAADTVAKPGGGAISGSEGG
jgi:hypothetical protein